MAQVASYIPLSRRLVGRYLAFALAGLLLCLATALTLAYRNSLGSLAFLAALGPAAVLLAGAVVLYHTARLHSVIAQQLQRIAEEGAAGPLTARRLTGADPIIRGWNALLERVSNQEMWANLEDRLSDAIGDLEHQKTATAFEQLPIPAAITDSSGKIELANQAFQALAKGLGADTVEQCDLLQVLELPTAENAKEVLSRLKLQQGSMSLEVRRGPLPTDGVLQISRKPMLKGGGETPGQIWIVRDITQQLLAEEMRNQFVLTATHELRTPLANIIAYAETLAIEDNIDVERQKEFCNIINAEATRLSRFVDELLNISQMEAGALSLQRHETDLARMFDEVLEHVKPEMASKDIVLEVTLPPKLPKLHLDKDKFASGMVNLLGNAAKYTPANGRVHFEVEHKGEDLEIHVEDSGIGIAEEELPRIFDKFFRSSDERLHGVSGNGLGLAFTQEVVRLHGGRIHVQSELDKGTRFSVSIPV